MTEDNKIKIAKTLLKAVLKKQQEVMATQDPTLIRELNYSILNTIEEALRTVYEIEDEIGAHK